MMDLHCQLRHFSWERRSASHERTLTTSKFPGSSLIEPEKVGLCHHIATWTWGCNTKWHPEDRSVHEETRGYTRDSEMATPHGPLIVWKMVIPLRSAVFILRSSPLSKLDWQNSEQRTVVTWEGQYCRYFIAVVCGPQLCDVVVRVGHCVWLFRFSSGWWIILPFMDPHGNKSHDQVTKPYFLHWWILGSQLRKWAIVENSISFWHNGQTGQVWNPSNRLTS